MKTWLLYILFLAFSLLSQTVRAQPKQGRLATSLDAGFSYDADLTANVIGGKARGLRYLDDLDLDVTIDLETLLNWKGTSLYVYGLGNQGGSISELAGDFQGVDNIEAENTWRLYEAWIQKIFLARKVSVLAGLYDLNSEFDVINTGLIFLNSSQGMGAGLGNSGVMGPSTFSFTSVGVRLKVSPLDGLTLKAAALDGVPSDPNHSRGTHILFQSQDGLLLASEVSYGVSSESKAGRRTPETRLQEILNRGAEDLKSIRFTAGAWLYTHKRVGWNGDQSRDRGLYASSEFRLYRKDSDPFEGLSGFVRAGISNGRVNHLEAYLGGGLIYNGLINGRPDDIAGLAVAHAVNSSDYRQISRSNLGYHALRAETSLKGTYAAMLAHWIQLQGDVQYVVHPGFNPNTDNALVLGIRTLFHF